MNITFLISKTEKKKNTTNLLGSLMAYTLYNLSLIPVSFTSSPDLREQVYSNEYFHFVKILIKDLL